MKPEARIVVEEGISTTKTPMHKESEKAGYLSM